MAKNIVKQARRFQNYSFLDYIHPSIYNNYIFLNFNTLTKINFYVFFRKSKESRITRDMRRIKLTLSHKYIILYVAYSTIIILHVIYFLGSEVNNFVYKTSNFVHKTTSNHSAS